MNFSKNYELTDIQIVPAESNQKKPTNTVRCPLFLGDGSIKHIERDCLEDRSWRMEFVSEGKGKAVPLQAWTKPDGSQEVKVPRFRDNGTG